MQKALSPARHNLEGTSHQKRPKNAAGDTFLLMEGINTAIKLGPHTKRT
jgi:hypothetical protein